jgi:hypothetical protein
VRGGFHSHVSVAAEGAFIAYTLVLLITVTLLLAFLFWWSSLYLAIPLALFAALSVIGTIDIFQTRHAVLRNGA